MFKKFKVKDIFELVGGKQPVEKDRFENPTDNLVPAITGVTVNNGTGFYTTKEGKKTYSNILTISKDGEYAGTVYLQDREVYLAGHSMGLIPKIEIDNDCLIYIASLFINYLKIGYWKINAQIPSVTDAKMDGVVISLPVIENSNSDHEYTVDDIDWQYMRDRITELERDRITELDAYLQSTGLNDYELTEEDKKVLSQKVETKEFVMHDVFEKLKAPYKGNGKKQDNVSKIQTKEFNLPLINCKYNNNGIMYYGRKSDYTYYENVLSVIYNGPPTEGQTYYQEEIGVYTDAYLIALKNKNIRVNREIGLYLASIVNASIHNEKQRKYSRGNKATWEDKVENDKIILPIKSDGTPDFDYMERYIRAMEKVVIADMVKYKDKVIETTKEVVGM